MNFYLIALIAWTATALPVENHMVGLESFLPAPPLPIEPGDPLEIDEINRMLLEDINKNPPISSVINARKRPFETGFILIMAVFFAIGVELFRRNLLKKESMQRISPVERKRLLEEAKKIKGKAALDLLHYLISERHGQLANELDTYRFQKDEPDQKIVEALFQKASILFDGNKHPS